MVRFVDYAGGISYFLTEKPIFLDKRVKPSVLSLFLVAVVGYLIGSIPTAYLFVRWKSKLDIRTAGSGNVGTLNSYTVTRSKLIGVLVLVVDLLKGFCAVLIAAAIAPGMGFGASALGGISAVVGHNFPFWLKFKGGRGLATAAGVLLFLQWLVIPFWGFWWAIGFLLTRNVNVGNAIACLVTLLAVLVLPVNLLAGLLPEGATDFGFRLFGVVLIGAVLLRHIEPTKRYIADRRGNVKKASL
jgi:glycerol-3-phosphate acyltransferase PlsY